MDSIVTITLSLTQERVGRADAHEFAQATNYWTAIAKVSRSSKVDGTSRGQNVEAYQGLQ
jgi:hypothetical protein